MDAELQRHGATAQHLLSDVREFLQRMSRTRLGDDDDGVDGSLLSRVKDLPVELRRRLLNDMLPGLRQPVIQWGEEWRQLVTDMHPSRLPGIEPTGYWKSLSNRDVHIAELVLDLERWILCTLLRDDNAMFIFDGLIDGAPMTVFMPDELERRLDSMDDKTRPDNNSTPYLLTEYLLGHGRWLALVWMLATRRRGFYELCLYAVQTDNLIALLFLLDRRRARMTDLDWLENPFQWTPMDEFSEKVPGQPKSVWDLRSAISHWMVLYGAWRIADFIWTIDQVDEEIRTVPHVLKLWAEHLHHAMPLGHLEFVVHLIVEKRLLDFVEPNEYDRTVRAVLANRICDLRLYRFFSSARPSDIEFTARQILSDRTLDAWINQWRHQPIQTALHTLRLIVRTGKSYSPDRIARLRDAIDDMFVPKKIRDDGDEMRRQFDEAVESLSVTRSVRQRIK